MYSNRLIFGIFVVVIAIIGPAIISQIFLADNDDDSDFEVFLDKSGPYIGANYPHKLGYVGSGIKIALIDTGVDYNHPDLLGFGKDGKVIGGYDFVDNDDMPMDTNGHGTEVAGIIAADGQLKGIAPQAKILAYRVSDDGESVSSDMIIKAIRRAMSDDANIINISLGVNKTNIKIDEVVNEAINKGIVVVTAAGNNGPGMSTIGSPAINPNSITVGSTYNNVTTSLVATLKVDDKQFQVLPMLGTEKLEEPISTEVVYGKYGRENDLADLDLAGKIVLVERGSDIQDEVVYFSIKEKNAADRGARAMLIHNNQPGIYLGELIHEFSGPDYLPRIPTLSMSRAEGLELKEQITQNKTIAELHVFYHPDFVAYFSSRGPVSPFYIKPDLVAPGAFVNTTLTNGRYNFTSGTSFAAPHVTGAAALLLQKDPSLLPHQVKSLIVTTTDPIIDPYGIKTSADIAGSGRLNVTSAFDADLIVAPTNLVFNLSPEKKSQTQYIEIKKMGDNSVSELNVSFEGNKAANFDYRFGEDYDQSDNRLHVTAYLTNESLGKFEDTIIIRNGNISYNIPILIHITKGGVSASQQPQEDGLVNFEIVHPDDENWSFAMISIINKITGTTYTTSATPTRDATISVYEAGQYWVEAKITSEDEKFVAYEIIEVKTPVAQDGFRFFDLLEIPQNPILIVSVIIVIIALVGLKIRKQQPSPF